MLQVLGFILLLAPAAPFLWDIFRPRPEDVRSIQAHRETMKALRPPRRLAR